MANINLFNFEKKVTMKKVLLLVAAMWLIAAGYGQKAPKKPAAKVKPPIANGIYYIVNAGNGKALQPAAASSGQNVFCEAFEDGNDSQQWAVKWNGKNYLIMPRGKNDLFLQPHPGIRDATAIISINMGNGGSALGIAATADTSLFVIKCLMYGGTSLYTEANGNENEVRNTHKQMGAVATWRFIAVKD
jgi:hypothetical protein